MSTISRRRFAAVATALAAALAFQRVSFSVDAPGAIRAEIAKRHDEGVRRLQDWIRQPSFAAENRGMTEGCDLMMRLAREAGFDNVTRVPTDGQPGVFATLDAGSPRTIGLYFMYDVKQADPAEWSSPPFDAALVDKPGLGKVVMGRGAVNQKGPEAIAALRKCSGIFMPSAEQDLDGKVTMTLGAKGVIECELVSSGEKWGRGPRKDVHSSTKAMLDSPAWHLVEALVTLVSPDGNTPAIDGFADKARPLS